MTQVLRRTPGVVSSLPCISPNMFTELKTAASGDEFPLFSSPAPAPALFFPPSFSLQAAAAGAGLQLPALQLQPPAGQPAPVPGSALKSGGRKRKVGGGLVTSGGSSGSPSQSRRFYKCLGCGAAKRWDRLTDHYRKVRQGRTLDGSG